MYIAPPLLQPNSHFLQSLREVLSTTAMKLRVHLIVSDALLVKTKRQFFGASFPHLGNVLLGYKAIVPLYSPVLLYSFLRLHSQVCQ